MSASLSVAVSTALAFALNSSIPVIFPEVVESGNVDPTTINSPFVWSDPVGKASVVDCVPTRLGHDVHDVLFCHRGVESVYWTRVLSGEWDRMIVIWA